MRKAAQLVSQHLENVSGDVLEDYPDIIREYTARRQGVYALYRSGRLYYVGLASDLRWRLKAHLNDRAQGMSLSELAEAHHVSKASICKVLKEASNRGGHKTSL